MASSKNEIIKREADLSIKLGLIEKNIEGVKLYSNCFTWLALLIVGLVVLIFIFSDVIKLISFLKIQYFGSNVETGNRIIKS